MKDRILEEYKKGNIVLSSIEGLQVMPLISFIKQPVEGILYDLNRTEAVILTFLDDPKWVNDYAVAQVILALKNRIEELENKTKLPSNYLESLKQLVVSEERRIEAERKNAILMHVNKNYTMKLILTAVFTHKYDVN